MGHRTDWAARFETVLRARGAGKTRDGGHDLGHLARVWRHASTIAEVEGGDLEVLAAAAWLHDLVNPPKDSPDRKSGSVLSAQAAAPLLVDEGFPAQNHANVLHCIEAHSFSAGIAPPTLEATILQDADRLDALGAIGIARCFCVAGQMGAQLFDPEDPLAKGRPLEDHRYALDHFEIKLLRLPEGLHTETARHLAAPRVARMRAFVAALADEACGAAGDAQDG